MKDRDGAATVEIVVAMMGGRANAARAMNVNRSSVTRWMNGQHALEGTALVAARAILRHPDEYREIAQQKSRGVGRRTGTGGD